MLLPFGKATDGKIRLETRWCRKRRTERENSQTGVQFCLKDAAESLIEAQYELTPSLRPDDSQ